MLSNRKRAHATTCFAMEDNFEDIDPYKVLGVAKETAAKDVKRAYHRMCLQYHPDKADGTRAEFDRVQVAYLVLSDESRRKLYDTTGRVCPWGPVSDWEAWTAEMGGKFEEITKDLIEKDRQQYQGSPEEVDDIKKEFVAHKGKFEVLFENIVHLEFSIEQEKRVFAICQDLLDKGQVDEKDVPKWKEYIRDRAKIVKRMQRRAQREAKMAGDAKRQDDMAGLQALIAKNSSRHRDTFGAIFEKYGGAEGDPLEDLPQPPRKKKKTAKKDAKH